MSSAAFVLPLRVARTLSARAPHACTRLGGGAVRTVSHRPYLRRDAERLRCVRDGAFVRAATNPGVRLEPEFVSDEHAAALVTEARHAAEEYGCV